MALFVKVVNGTVTEVLESIPTWDIGNPQWKSAVEVRPVINNRDEYYGSHYFDLLKDPVEIIWPVQTLTVAEKRSTIIQRVVSLKTFVVEQEVKLNDVSFLLKPTDVTKISTIIEYIDTKLPILSTLNTHAKVNRAYDLYDSLRTTIETLTSSDRGQLLYELTSNTAEQALSAEVAPSVQERIQDLLGKIHFVKEYAVERCLKMEKNKSGTRYFDFPFLISLFDDLHTKTSTLTGMTTHTQLNNAYRVYDERMTYLKSLTAAVGSVNW